MLTMVCQEENAHTFENEAQTARKNRFDFPKRFCFFYCILSFIE